MKIALIVGASGSGKDSLLRAATVHFSENDNVTFLQRYITRPADQHEHNYFLDSSAFEMLKENNFFISHWQAHGNRYGIARNHLNGKGGDGLTVISISRKAVVDFEREFRDVFTIKVEVKPEILRDRLRNRNRENEQAVEQRLKRAGLPIQARELIRFDNSAPLRVTVSAFNQLLSSLRTR